MRVVSLAPLGLVLSLLAVATPAHAQCTDESARVSVSVQYARFHITFGNRPPVSSIRVFIGDRGPGSLSMRNGQGIDISGDATPDGTPVLGLPASDEGSGAGVNYQDGVVHL